MKNIVSTDDSVKRQITDSISKNLTDSDLECIQISNIKCTLYINQTNLEDEYFNKYS